MNEEPRDFITIRDEFNALIDAEFPDGCTLTHKKRREREDDFYRGFRAALVTFIRASEKPQEDAEAHLERLFQEVEKRMEQIEEAK